jgi:hypothetical protein
MASLSIAFPIPSERFEQARRWGREKTGPRNADLTESNRDVGLSRESWHLQQLPDGGGLLILSCEGPDLAATFADYAAADGAYERWEKQEIRELTGVDLGQPLHGPAPETLVDWRQP